MDIWVIYRIIKNHDTGRIDKIETIEYASNEAEARKYSRLFDLQVPIDLKDKISHKYQSTALFNE